MLYEVITERALASHVDPGRHVDGGAPRLRELPGQRADPAPRRTAARAAPRLGRPGRAHAP